MMRPKVWHRKDQTRNVLLERLEDRLLLALNAQGAAPSCLIVDTTVDVVDANDAVNSLREAITCANLSPGADTINVPAGTYTLTITGSDEDANATGDLDVTDDLTILGGDAATTII